MKFIDLEAQGFKITVKQVEDALEKPDNIIGSRKGRLLAQKTIDGDHVIRVIYERRKIPSE